MVLLLKSCNTTCDVKTFFFFKVVLLHVEVCNTVHEKLYDRIKENAAMI